MSKFLIASWLFVLLSFAVHAGGIKAKPGAKHLVKVLRIDSSKVQVRSFNNDAIQQYTKDKDFQYDEGKLAEMSLWSRFWHWIWGLLSAGVAGGFSLFAIILFIAFIGFLVYVVIKVSGINIGHVFRGRAKQIDIPYSESLENIHEINFDDEIEKAIGQRNFKLAVRLLYLRSLANRKNKLGLPKRTNRYRSAPNLWFAYQAI
jgi:hypothetical protein